MTPGPGSYNLKESVSEIIKEKRFKIKPAKRKVIKRPIEKLEGVGPGAYNPDIEATRTKRKVMIIYQSPKQSTVVDKIYKYLNEIKAMGNHRKEIEKESLQKKSYSYRWHRPERKCKEQLDDNPGPGSYDTKDSLLSSNKALKFNAQGRDVTILNKDNNLLITTSNAEPTPGVGTYFPSSFFKWSYSKYPSKS